MESELQKQCNDYLRKLEKEKKLVWWHREKGRNPRSQAYSRNLGFPDMVIFFPTDRCLMIELKDKGKLNNNQLKFRQRCFDCDITYHVVNKFSVFCSLVNFYLREYSINGKSNINTS